VILGLSWVAGPASKSADLVLRGLRRATRTVSKPSVLSERSFEAALLDLLDHPNGLACCRQGRTMRR
jgi:hypothetical protein